jgi:hypothetical protein
MFSSPLWLAALATLGIPLALHLWSRRPRQVIRVGTLRHLDQLPPARARSARLSEPLLLLLRLGILASVVLALAGPRLRGTELGRASRLVLVDPALLGDAALDSLSRARAVVRLLLPGLPEVRLPAVRDTSEPPLSVWDGLRLADRLVSPDGAIEVYARPRLTTLGERRPAIRADVRWHSPAPVTSGRWLVELTALPGDSLQAIIGEGDGSGVRYRRLRVHNRSELPVVTGLPAAALAVRRLAIPVTDSASRRRVALALRAVSEELGQDVTLAADAAGADTIITLSRDVIASPALADSALARWPWRPDLRDPLDPREVTLATALPATAVGAPETEAPPRTRELLLLAGLLLLVERWLAARPRRSAV